MSTTPQHGIALACYAKGPGKQYYQPYMECLCGFSTGRCASWQDAGEMLDAHLKGARIAIEQFNEEPPR